VKLRSVSRAEISRVKTKVVIAKYRPLTRSESSPISRPTIPTPITAIGSTANGAQPFSIVSSVVV
jgi:hypothetical protein